MFFVKKFWLDLYTKLIADIEPLEKLTDWRVYTHIHTNTIYKKISNTTEMTFDTPFPYLLKLSKKNLTRISPKKCLDNKTKPGMLLVKFTNKRDSLQSS